MNRKDFIKKTGLGAAAVVGATAGLRAKNVRLKHSDYDKMMKQVGFNHIPNNEMKTTNTVLHRASTRGHANHGWLDSHHSFSFANYYNPERMNFGVLRVLNDDKVSPGMGFGTHPHDNMEIISIPLKGDLEHKDSMGNTAVIKEGDIQVMSAGTGVYHSEYNKNKDQNVEFLQIWVFPNKRDVQPRYDQMPINSVKTKNEFYQVLSPNKTDQGVWVHQNAWFSMSEVDPGKTLSYTVHSEQNGIYVFLLGGQVEIEKNILNPRDGFGVWNRASIEIKSTKASRILLMEVPMNIG
jgi:redox-sensitive bicupin YhaK (pirin superfamily)